MKNANRGGRATFAGTNAQALAALSLFLQHLKDPSFSHIELEAEGFEDFNLAFKDGTRIICESKALSTPLSFAKLKSILRKILNKKKLQTGDSILIVCKKASEQLLDEIRWAGYFDEPKKRLRRQGFSEVMIDLLPRVNFYQTTPGVSKEIIYSLFSEAVGFWMPEEDVERNVHDVLFRSFFEGSERGMTYSRQDVLQKISTLAEEVKKNSVHYEEDRKTRLSQFKKLEKALSNPSHTAWKLKELSAFSTDRERIYFAREYFTNKVASIDLARWAPLWDLDRVYPWRYGLFKIFQHNLHTDGNVEYVLNFLRKKLDRMRQYYRDDFLEHDAVETMKKIIELPTSDKWTPDILDVVCSLMNYQKADYLYSGVRGGHTDESDRHRDLLALTKTLYDRGNVEIKQRIIEMVITRFDLTEDDSDFSHRVPKDAFEILKAWLCEDFTARFAIFVKLIVSQYDDRYKKHGGPGFKGWEHAGGGIGFSGGHYHVSDRHFVSYVLEPAIQQYYEQDRKAGWKFVKQHCITPQKRVSKSRPDFLSRAAYKVALSEYANGSSEAFGVLSELILQRQGIPHKGDLIIQELTRGMMPKEFTWRLIEVVLKKYKIPTNPFVEQIASDFAKSGFLPALDALKRWYKEPGYYGRRALEIRPIANIKALLDTDLTTAVGLLCSLIENKQANGDKHDYFEAFDIAALLHDVLKRDYQQGISIIRLLESHATLNTQLQVIYTFSLFNNHGSDRSDDVDLLIRLYKDVVDPFLTSYGDDAVAISKRLPWDACREALVQFAGRLARQHKIAEALRIIRIFINDPDPYLPGKNPSDPKDEHCEHARILEGRGSPNITSTRGWCAWVLMECAILDGRPYIEEIIRIAKKLLEDENYYVVHMACRAFNQIAHNRLTVLPENRDTLFLNDDKKKALEMAKDIEEIGFRLLERLLMLPQKAQEALAAIVVDALAPIRSLNQEDALWLLQRLAKLPDDGIAEAAPIFIFFAEFRKETFKDWRFALPGLYDDLSPRQFNPKKFKELLMTVVRAMQKRNPDACFKFAANVEHLMRDPSIRTGPQKRYDDLAYEYFEFLSDTYSSRVFTIIYQVIEKKLAEGKGAKKWLTLFMKCINVENSYYHQAVADGKASEVRWLPSLFHSTTLEIIYKNFGRDSFIQAADVYFSFPDEVELNESLEIVQTLKKLSSSSSRAKKMFKNLLNKHPSKYFSLTTE